MLKINTKTSTLPVSLTMVKSHLNIVGDDHNDYLTHLIWTAAEYIERQTDRSYSQTTWEEYRDDLPCGTMLELSRSPLVSVTSVTYHDTANVQQTLSTDAYTVSTPKYLPGYLVAVDKFPTTNMKKDNVKITYVTGASDYNFTHAVLLLVSHYYEHRESEIEITTKPLDTGLKNIINMLKPGGYR